MPNILNVESPLTLIANGRSGTSLISQMIHRHPDAIYIGETVNLIHGVYKSMEESLITEKQYFIASCIRNLFITLFQSDEKTWFHKPIGVPIIYKVFPNVEEFLDWYWDVMLEVFPNAKFFTVMRDPMEVIISSHRWWNRNYRDIIDSVWLMSRIIAHPKSRIEFAIDFIDLVENQESTTRKILDFCSLEYKDQCLGAFENKLFSNKIKVTDIEKETLLKIFWDCNLIDTGIIEDIQKGYRRFDLEIPILNF